MKIISGNPYLKKEENDIFIDSVSLDEFLKISNTPLMIFLENRIKDNINSFRNIFSSVFKNFECFYSFKANFLPEICNIIKNEDIGAQIVGMPELKLALKVGINPNKIIVGGPYLPRELIIKCVEKQIKEIIVYDLNDINKINSIAKSFNRVQNVCVRINSQKFDSKLGVLFDENKIKLLKKMIDTFKNINLSTILSHYTSQMNSVEQFKKNINIIVENVKKLSKFGIFLENINLGGGFPEATIMAQYQLKRIALAIKEHLDEFDINYEHIYFEPGRYFVGDAGFFISEIVKVCENRWIFLNIGNHICPKFANCSLRFYNASNINEPHKYKTSIAGIVPTDQDVLAKDYFFTEKIKEGDKVLVTNAGAYTITFSNRFPYQLPSIFLVKGNNLKRIFDPSQNGDICLS